MEQQSFGGKVKRIFKKILIGLIITALIILGVIYWGVYDDGLKAGKVVSVSHKGWIFKTYEAKINLGTFGALKNASPIAETFDLSIESGDEELIKQFQEVALSGERVNIYFIKRYMAFPWRGDTRYFAVRIERSKDPQ